MNKKYESTRILIVSIVKIFGVYFATFEGSKLCGTGQTEHEALLELAMEYNAAKGEELWQSTEAAREA